MTSPVAVFLDLSNAEWLYVQIPYTHSTDMNSFIAYM